MRFVEDVQASLYPGRTLLCDRGTVDGAAYWPGDPSGYFKAVGSSLKAELDRYSVAIFFETAAVGGTSIEGGNRIRTESQEEAVALDTRLRALWSQHPRFILVPHNPSFFKKISFGLAALEGIFSQYNGGLHPRAAPAPRRATARPQAKVRRPAAKGG